MLYYNYLMEEVSHYQYLCLPLLIYLNIDYLFYHQAFFQNYIFYNDDAVFHFENSYYYGLNYIFLNYLSLHLFVAYLIFSFSNEQLKFDGEYLKGKKWNGKGRKYYYVGNIKIKCVYSNGKKWNVEKYDENNKKICEIKESIGYVIKYYYNGNLKFEGECINGEKNGKRKEYDKDGKLIFEEVYQDEEKIWKGNTNLKNILIL